MMKRDGSGELAGGFASLYATLCSHGVRSAMDVVVPTWFGVGGRAGVMAAPVDAAELAVCLAAGDDVLVLGEGANLLVLDGGVGGLVVRLSGAGWRGIGRVDVCDVVDAAHADGRVLVRAGGGADLMKLVAWSVREGLGGLEGLGGIPASVGGAAVMNAGGAFGSFGDRVVRVRGVDREGQPIEFSRDDCGFGYRRSALRDRGVVVTEVVFGLDVVGSDGGALRERLKEVMAYKKGSQPMAEASAGCAFKNPTLLEGIDGVGVAGDRVSAGKLIDLAGCKGLRLGSAVVSERHANFITAALKREDGGRADDVYGLMLEVRGRVFDRFGVRLEREVVVWGPMGVVGDDEVVVRDRRVAAGRVM